MSVMTRTTDGTFQVPGPFRASQIQQAPTPDPAMQRQAVMDQLAPPTASANPRPGTVATPATPGAPTTGSASAFSRGGTVTELPSTVDKKKLAETAATTGLNTAAKIGGQTAGGAAASMGVGLATGYLADKLRVKEEMPTFGGAHGALTDDYGRRFEGTGGGVASNATRYAGYGAAGGPIGMGIGAGIGAIVGAATKNAPSAYTDFRVEDAAEAIGKAYETYLGRPASEDEIRNQLVGQGWNPTGGDRWVGEKNLTGQGGVLDQIRDSPEGKAFALSGVPAGAREAVLDQLAAPPDEKAATPGTVPGSAPAGPLGTGTAGPDNAAARAAFDQAGAADAAARREWNTDGYAAPGYTAPVGGDAPPGWDAQKWNDPNHQTPKYVVGRILNQYGGTPEGVQRAMGDLEKAYPGTTFNGKDKLTIPGVGTIDVVRAAGLGGQGIQWLPEGGDGGEAASGPTPTTGGGLGKADGSGDLLADLRAAIDRITRGEAPRAELMAQLGGA